MRRLYKYIIRNSIAAAEQYDQTVAAIKAAAATGNTVFTMLDADTIEMHRGEASRLINLQQHNTIAKLNRAFDRHRLAHNPPKRAAEHVRLIEDLRWLPQQLSVEALRPTNNNPTTFWLMSDAYLRDIIGVMGAAISSTRAWLSKCLGLVQCANHTLVDRALLFDRVCSEYDIWGPTLGISKPPISVGAIEFSTASPVGVPSGRAELIACAEYLFMTLREFPALVVTKDAAVWFTPPVGSWHNWADRQRVGEGPVAAWLSSIGQPCDDIVESFSVMPTAPRMTRILLNPYPDDAPRLDNVVRGHIGHNFIMRMKKPSREAALQAPIDLEIVGDDFAVVSPRRYVRQTELCVFVSAGNHDRYFRSLAWWVSPSATPEDVSAALGRAPVPLEAV